MRRICLLFALLASTAYGQINVPAESEPYSPIVAEIVAQVPEGATFNGGWTKDEDCQSISVGNSLYLWAPPGKHTLKYSGYWVHTKDVTFKDGAGNDVTITSFLGSGFISEEAEFAVLGGDPVDPPPGPGPTPGEPRQIVFFIEADNLDKMPANQKYLVTSLKARQDLGELGHNVLQVVDDDQIREGVPERWVPWVKAVINDSLPRVAFAPLSGGTITDFPLPADWEGLLALLGGAQ